MTKASKFLGLMEDGPEEDDIVLTPSGTLGSQVSVSAGGGGE